VSIYSCWEIAKLVEYGKLELKFSIKDWLEIALSHPNLRSIDLTIPIIIKSTQLPGFHKDPADQIIRNLGLKPRPSRTALQAQT
jgi:PIN domain nuclease of toxin-antitoxin system